MPRGEDFITEFVYFTRQHVRDTPDVFRRWCAICMVASSLERRVWAPVGGYVVYPNMYTILVAPSGHGKGLIMYAKEMLREVRDAVNARKPAFHVSPDNMTKASMIDDLAKAEVTFIPPKGSPLRYHAMNIYSEDLNVWMPAYDADTFGALLYIWGNPAVYQETRRTSISKEKNIERPMLNLLVGVQPFVMGALFPEEAWYTGITRRAIMIYSYEPEQKKRLSDFKLEDATQRGWFVSKLGEFSKLYGEYEWEPAAYQKIVEWDFAGGKPAPEHSRLEAYVKSRTIFLEKLAMISAVSRCGGLSITSADVDRGLHWLQEAEATMPDIFRAMRGKNDAALLEEMWRWAGREVKLTGKPIPRPVVVHWLSRNCTSEKVEKLFNIATGADVIRKFNNVSDDYIPGPKEPGRG